MKTKNEVIDYVKSEVENGNTVYFCTTGQGGNGINVVDDLERFVEELESYEFEGFVNKTEHGNNYKFVEKSTESNPYTVTVLVYE